MLAETVSHRARFAGLLLVVATTFVLFVPRTHGRHHGHYTASATVHVLSHVGRCADHPHARSYVFE
jgi:hypothetical protein